MLLDVVVDQAEIPTFQEKLRIDTDGDGSVSDAEAEAERLAACPALAPSLSLSVAGTPLALRAVEAGLTFPPGAAGMATMRLVCVYLAELPGALAPASTIAFADTSGAGRIGWREIDGRRQRRDPRSGLAAGRERLRPAHRLPGGLIPKPLDIRSASFDVSPGGPDLAPFTVPDATALPGAASLDPSPRDDAGRAAAGSAALSGAARGAGAGVGMGAAESPGGAVPGGVGGEISGLLEARDLTPLVLVGALLAAMALGAGHALTPGHGKTLMGAYLVGTRGTPVHAVALGLSVTVSHTLGILVLAASSSACAASSPPELFNRGRAGRSGLLVLGIGAWLLVGQVAKRGAPRARRRPIDRARHDHDGGPRDDHDLATPAPTEPQPRRPDPPPPAARRDRGRLAEPVRPGAGRRGHPLDERPDHPPLDDRDRAGRLRARPRRRLRAGDGRRPRRRRAGAGPRPRPGRRPAGPLAASDAWPATRRSSPASSSSASGSG